MDDSTGDNREQPPWGDLCPIPHMDAEGRARPPLLALGGLENRLVSSLEVVGDAMHPDLRAGDLVVFVRHSGHLEDGGLYVLAGHAGLAPRRLQLLADGGWLAVPSNPCYGREPVDPRSGIVGPVVAVVRRTP
ncbi:MAG: S24 family peptidase [Pseudomonadota bacterium]